ncbi:amidohydrolase [Occultella glacieicola]|uniref:Amidohydrolase n=1 Tax=Occultella glacieicola TaxID=2518684 RepID=A0ABY2E241_9MICO|nr:amidohydrolase family protein [Occultella glacieicola]TDE92665.1 amidohydrolase [Occultella glacieicola]
MTSKATSPTAPGGDPVIDLHAHILPPALLHARAWSGVPDPWRPAAVGPDRAAAADEPWLQVTIGDRPTSPIPPALVSLPQRLATMDHLGVDVQVVSPWMELYPRGLAADGVEAHVRVINDAVVQEVHAAPGRLLGLGMVPLTSGAAAAHEARRAVAELGLAGVIVATSGVGLPLEDADLRQFWATTAELGAVVLIHPVLPLAAERMRVPPLGDLIGHPLETTTAVATLLRTGILDRHPDLRLVVPHGGGAIPALADRIGALWEHSGGPVTATAPAATLGRIHYDVLTHSDRALRWLEEFTEPGRLVLGTDYPFATGDVDALARARRVLTSASLPGALGRNAAALLPHGLRTPRA